jgi:PST family polysaccharide transporter
MLSPDDYGLLAMTTGIVAFATVLGDLGLSMAALQSRTITPAQQSNLFWLNTASGILLFLVFNACTTVIVEYYQNPGVASLCRILSLNFVFNGMSAQFRIEANRRGQFGRVSLVESIAGAVGIAVGVTGATFGLGARALGWQQVAVAGVTLVGLVLAVRWRPGMPSRHAQMRQLVSFGGSVMLIQMLVAINQSVDAVALGRYQLPSVVGVYDRSRQISVMPIQQLATPMTRLAIPKISQEGPAAGSPLVPALAVHEPLAFISTAMLALVAMNGELFARVLLGANWVGVGHVVSALSLAAAIQMSGYVYYWLLVASGQQRTLLLSELVPRVTMIIAIFALAKWGVLAVAWCWVGGQALMIATACIYALPRIGVTTGEAFRVAFRYTWPFVLITGTFPWVVELVTVHAGWGIDSHYAVALASGLAAMGAALVVWRDGRSMLGRIFRLAKNTLKGVPEP